MAEIDTRQWGADPDRLLGYRELSEWTGVPDRSVRKWVADGTGPPAIRIGRYARFRVRDVLAWLDSRTTSAA